MIYILDRFEGELAVLVNEDGDTLTLKRDLLPERREGDLFEVTDGKAPVYNASATEERRRLLTARFARLVKKDNNLS